MRTPILTALQAALDQLLAMRAKEGANLKRDLTKRIKAMRSCLHKVKKLQPRALNAIGRICTRGFENRELKFRWMTIGWSRKWHIFLRTFRFLRGSYPSELASWPTGGHFRERGVDRTHTGISLPRDRTGTQYSERESQ